jgi:hypothetical protein
LAIGPIGIADASNSLILVENSLFLLRKFPVPMSREFRTKSPEIIGLAGRLMREASPKTVKFPVLFPVTRELVVETGSRTTASATTQILSKLGRQPILMM